MGMIEQFAQLKPTTVHSWLSQANQNGGAVWRDSVWPNRKTEAWRYTNLRCIEKGIEQGGYLNQLAEPSVTEPSSLKALFNIEGLNSAKVVFVNGVFCSELSSLGEQSTVTVVPFSAANEQQAQSIKASLNSALPASHPVFAALNNHLLSDGVFVHLGRNTVANQPVQVVHVTTKQTQSFNVQQRLLVVLEEGAEATVIEQFVSTDDTQNVFVNGITELCVGANALLKHYRLNQEQEATIHIGAVHANLGKNASLNSFYLAQGSELKRIDAVVNFLGEHAECVLNGVYIPHRNQHVDFHTCIEHKVPNCTSQEVFRGIIGDTAKAVFNGRIHIHQDAQKTLAQLSNKNLLTSDKAEVNTKPELEIYADDVQCAHGATVAQLDETSMHYLRTRGVSEKEAEVMLSFGFINELINKIELQSVQDYLRPLLAGHFARDPELLRHIL